MTSIAYPFQINLESVLINLEHVKDSKSIIISETLGIVVAFSASKTYQSIEPINQTLLLTWLSMLGQTIINHVLGMLSIPTNQ